MSNTSRETEDLESVHGLKNFKDGEFEKMQGKAFALCNEYLAGAWRTIQIEDFVLKKIGGGLSNLLYYCALPDGVEPLCSEPSHVLLRIYGPAQDGQSVLEKHFTECVVFTMLSEKERGPRLFGIFPGGRLEEYIPARPLKTDELLDEEISKLVAESIAQIHSMSVPLSKEPSCFWKTVDRWVDQINLFLENVVITPDNGDMVRCLREIDLESEVLWLKNFLDSLRSPVVFCHNDTQEGNILLRDGPAGDKSVILIDFEYCAYNYRAYDLANHFCEMMYDYSNEEFPYFWFKPNNYPSIEHQTRFAQSYLSKYNKTESVSQEEIDRLLSEVDAFVLGTHMHWGLWSVVTATSSTIAFDYWGWGYERFVAYIDHKRKITKSHEECTNVERCIEDTAALTIEKTSRSPTLIESI